MISKHCGYPAVPTNARVHLSASGQIVAGTVVTYECDEGYELFGTDRRECTADATWSNELPFCGMYLISTGTIRLLVLAEQVLITYLHLIFTD